MKKISLILVFFLSVTSYGKEIPTPFWYSISEKILAGTQQLISPEETPVKPVVKVKVQKVVKPVRVPLKCQPKHDKCIAPTPFFTASKDGVWTEAE